MLMYTRVVGRSARLRSAATMVADAVDRVDGDPEERSGVGGSGSSPTGVRRSRQRSGPDDRHREGDSEKERADGDR